MPIIVVRNWPSKISAIKWAGRKDWQQQESFVIADMISDDNRFKRELGKILRKAVIEAKIPGIDSVSMVTVSFDQGRVLDDELLVVEVVGLFDRPDRTKAVLNRLADYIKAAVNSWDDQQEVEILVHRFNLEINSYTRG